MLQSSDSVKVLAEEVHLNLPLPPPSVYCCHTLPTIQGLLALLLDGLEVLFTCDSLASLSTYCSLSVYLPLVLTEVPPPLPQGAVYCWKRSLSCLPCTA